MGLTVSAGGCTVRELTLNRFDEDGIRLEANGGNLVEACYLGTDAVGTGDLGNGGVGITISSNGNTVGGTAPAQRNLISGNSSYGVVLTGPSATGNVVTGNYIGLDRTGTADLGNSSHGIMIEAGASSNHVGGETAGKRNVISGNGSSGIQITGAGSDFNVVRGNLIGTTAAGTDPMPNIYGITILNGAASDTLGGSAAGAGNVISGNTANGVRIDGTGTDGHVIQGNFIGVDITGLASLGNQDGLGMHSASRSNIVGGAADGARNLISGHRSGVWISGSGTDGHTLKGNYIGTDSTGIGDLGNTNHGIYISSSCNSNLVGGSSDGEGNIIAFTVATESRVSFDPSGGTTTR